MAGATDQMNEEAPRSKQGPQGTQFFSKEDLDRLISGAVTEPPKGAPVALRGASESVAGRLFGLDQPRVLVGRSAHCDIVVNDPSISSEHARLASAPGGWVITNLLSTNGTFVNGKRATTVPLKHGDHVRIGRIEFVFEMPDGQSGATPSQLRSRTAAWVGWSVVVVLAVAAAVVGWWQLS